MRAGLGMSDCGPFVPTPEPRRDVEPPLSFYHGRNTKQPQIVSPISEGPGVFAIWIEDDKPRVGHPRPTGILNGLLCGLHRPSN
ncbi:protein of unknown function (plasmid) [Methylocella tundrae]|uniref:Uncharacterized protein n=1 Tax=Methylocella tundrae TaxID=227605 RepID=A0A4U8Z799_METTU|nr:protein of unknown function [Methylocella tundrae]